MLALPNAIASIISATTRIATIRAERGTIAFSKSMRGRKRVPPLALGMKATYTTSSASVGRADKANLGRCQSQSAKIASEAARVASQIVLLGGEEKNCIPNGFRAGNSE